LSAQLDTTLGVPGTSTFFMHANMVGVLTDA